MFQKRELIVFVFPYTQRLPTSSSGWEFHDEAPKITGWSEPKRFEFCVVAPDTEMALLEFNQSIMQQASVSNEIAFLSNEVKEFKVNRVIDVWQK